MYDNFLGLNANLEASPAVSFSLITGLSVREARQTLKRGVPEARLDFVKVKRVKIEDKNLTFAGFLSRFQEGSFLIFTETNKVFAFRSGELLNDEMPSTWDIVRTAWQIF